jgi:hypothetical protein
MVEMQVDMVFVLTDAPPFADFGGHRARDDIAAGEVLGAGGIAFHEPLTLRIS